MLACRPSHPVESLHAPHRRLLFLAAFTLGLYRPCALHGHRAPPSCHGELQAGRARPGLCGHRRTAAPQASPGAAAIPHVRAAALAREARPCLASSSQVLAVRWESCGSLIAAAREHDPDRFLRGGFAGIWEHERNLGEEHSLIDIARAADLPAAELLAAAKADAAQKRYEANVRDAIAADAFGSPCYVLDGEVFWGQDRLELLDDALACGRPPYRSDA